MFNNFSQINKCASRLLINTSLHPKKCINRELTTFLHINFCLFDSSFNLTIIIAVPGNSFFICFWWTRTINILPTFAAFTVSPAVFQQWRFTPFPSVSCCRLFRGPILLRGVGTFLRFFAHLYLILVEGFFSSTILFPLRFGNYCSSCLLFSVFNVAFFNQQI